MSNYRSDVIKERYLGDFLDMIYSKLGLKFERVSDKSLQLNGVDLVYNHGGKSIYIDEKAQLDYLNSNLPTFTFELSYLYGNEWKLGWLCDRNKITDFYFLITAIMVANPSKIEDGIFSVKITSVNRRKLVFHLASIGLNKERLLDYEKQIRLTRRQGRVEIKELKSNFGVLYFSPQKTEEPINLQLKLKYLLSQKIAKQIYPRVV